MASPAFINFSFTQALKANLISFAVNSQGNNIILIRMAESKFDYYRYEIEWSANGRKEYTFTGILFPLDQRSTTYQLKHKDAVLKAVIGCYRLKLLIRMGTFRYSHAAVVRFEGKHKD
jgi:hypothetical protein